MSLGWMWTENRIREFIDQQRDTITCWKVVKVKTYRGIDRIYPLFQSKRRAFKRTNVKKRQGPWIISRTRNSFDNSFKEVSYRANYHLCLNYKEAYAFSTYDRKYRVVECEVNMEDITAMGREGNTELVIVKKFIVVDKCDFFLRRQYNVA